LGIEWDIEWDIGCHTNPHTVNPSSTVYLYTVYPSRLYVYTGGPLK